MKKKLRHRCFPINFAKSLKTPFFTEQPRTTASALNNAKFYSGKSLVFLLFECEIGRGETFSFISKKILFILENYQTFVTFLV